MKTARSLAVAAALLAAASGQAQAGSKFALTSSDLPAGKSWNDKFIMNEMGCSGGNVSPALSWKGAPEGTKSFAIMMYDPFPVPESGWWHWVLFDIPPATTSLPTGAGSVGNEALLPAGAKHGLADGDAPKAHYYGPCPDIGDPPHKYKITVYALKIDHIDVPPTATPADINYLAMTNALGKASITRPYQRKAN
jgi:Raf kinase inhibitor-like YbhB/YbcL family protein